MTMTALRPTFDGATLRRALGHVPTAVSVVTACDQDGPVGMTVGSFTSISLDPPLVGFFVDAGSATAARVQSAGRFCVNVLTQDQHAICGSFASRVPDRFAGITHGRAENGAVRIDDAVAWIECDIEEVVTLGDHELVVGRVTTLEVPNRPVRPLVFFRGTLCDLDRRTVPSRGDWQRDHYADWW